MRLLSALLLLAPCSQVVVVAIVTENDVDQTECLLYMSY